MKKSFFYYLDSPAPAQNTYSYANIVGGGVQHTWCKACGGSVGIKKILPLKINLFGKNISDFVWTDSEEFLVSDQLLNIFEIQSTHRI